MKRYNPFWEHLQPLIQLIEEIICGHSTRAESFETKPLKQCILQAIDQFEKKALACQRNAEVTYKIKYACVAFVDELIVRRMSIISRDWMISPLQQYYYGETNSGENFYHLLAELRLKPQLTIDALEVYYFFLELGFLGRFNAEKVAERMRLKEDLFSQINTFRPLEKVDYCEAISRVNNPSYPQTKATFKKAVFAVCIALVTSMIGLNILISWNAEHYRQTLMAY